MSKICLFCKIFNSILSNKLSTSAWEDDEILSSVISTTHKSSSLKSVGASYYSYLTGIEKQLREEKDARK